MMEEKRKNSEQVMLIAGDQHITCDKSKLKTASSYFGAMFNSDMIESEASEIHLQAVDSSLLELLVDFAENDQKELKFNEHNAQELLQLACMLQFNDATSVIERYLLDNVTCSNTCGVILIADMCGLNALYNKARTIAEWWFEDVIEEDEIVELSYELFLDLVSSNTLNVNSELTVFKVIERWLLHSYLERCEHYPSLLSCVQWEAISEVEFYDVLEASPLFQETGVKEHVLDSRKKLSTEETASNFGLNYLLAEIIQ